jgi:hypothetical protein
MSGMLAEFRRWCTRHCFGRSQGFRRLYIAQALKTLVDDERLDVKWRRRFEEAAWRLDG